MSTLIKNANIIYPGHTFHGSTLDILVENGKITKIASGIENTGEFKEVNAQSLMLFPALVDAQCTIGEPGFEYKEDLHSAAEAAKNGGFSVLMMLPNTNPVLDNRGQLEYLKQKTAGLGVNIKPYSNISKEGNGVDLSEMYDMHEGGASAFSDGKRSINDVNLMKRALEYTQSFGGIVCNFPFDDRINPGAMVHESKQNIKLGIKSSPSIAEELMVNRDLYLQRYAGGALHLSTISTAGSVEILHEAKARGQKVSCSVALANLLYTDASLESFDTNYKTLPVLREVSDKQALIEGLKSGVIDIIVTDHTPENIENKDVEFDHASYGMTMIETALSLINEHLIADLGWDVVIQRMAIAPRQCFNIALPDLSEGSAFEFTLFDPNHTWTYNKASKASKSANTPVYNQALKGKVIRL
jgi:dihydroorotase